MSIEMPSSASKMVVDASVSRLLAYCSVETKTEKIFIRVSQDAKKQWKQMCDNRGVKQQLAGARLFEWIVRQNKAVQQAILNGGSVKIVGGKQHISLIVDAEESTPDEAIRGGRRPRKPAQSRMPEKNGK